LRRRLEQSEQCAFGELLFLAHDLGRDTFSIDCEWNEDGLAIIARDSFAAKGNIDNLEFHGSHELTIAQPFKAGMQMSISEYGSRKGERASCPLFPNDADETSALLSLGLRHGVFDRGFESLKIHGLDQVFGKARLQAFLDVAVHAKPADGDPTEAGRGTETGHEFQTAAIRQTDITDEKIERTPFHSFQGRPHVASDGYGVAPARQQFFQGGTGVGMIVHEKDAERAANGGHGHGARLPRSFAFRHCLDFQQETGAAIAALALGQERAAMRFRDRF
jgi:hypothetical protein